MSRGERDWTQLDAFEAEYQERLRAEQQADGESPFLQILQRLGRGHKEFAREELRRQDNATGRLLTLRGKILALRQKLGLPDESPLLALELPFLPGAAEPEVPTKKPPLQRIRMRSDPAPAGHRFPVTYADIRALLGELPEEHIAPIVEIRLSNQKNTGAEADWLEGEIRLHCLMRDDGDGRLRRLMGRLESGQDVERFGGSLQWEGSRLWAVWPADAYQIFVLRRVLVHEVAHGVAELPGYADAVRRAGSLEKFCEQYAENFYRPPGKSIRLGY